MAWKKFPYKPRESKYHNKKLEFEGMKFDSRKELNRWHELRILQRAGEISELRRQVSFQLIPALDWEGNALQSRKGAKEWPVYYVADFAYIDKNTDKTVVEDVKGYKTPEYVIKRKLMLERYGIVIKEI